MKLMRLLTFLVPVLCCSITYAGDIVEIPLEEIWSSDRKGMWSVDEPVTRDISELEKIAPGSMSLMAEIRKAHSFGTWEDEAGPAFAVEGTGADALKNAHDVITGKKPRTNSLSGEHEISIVFFTLHSNYYVPLTHVERDKNTILVRYEFIPHYTENLSRHFALIPLGKLPCGQYKVDITAEPFAQRFIDAGFQEIPDERKLRRVSSSFEFDVE